MIQTINYDNQVISVKASQYFIYKTYYQRQNYTMNAYLNNLTLIDGVSRNTDFSTSMVTEAPYLEQRLYQDGTYYNIRKFQSEGFINRASKEQIDEETALNT